MLGGAQRETNCDNAIAEIGGKFVAIVAMPLPKMGEKKISGYRNLGRN